MAEHIDRTRLLTNLRYNFDYISKFLNFTKDDINTLNSLAPILFPRISSIVETVYKKLYSFDITKQYFVRRNDDFEVFSSNTEINGTILSAQTDFRKDMLSMYLKRILIQSEWNDAFLQFLSYVGELHGNNKNSQSINVDYIHVNALLGYLEHLILDIIWNIENLDMKKKRDSIRTINKFFWIQNHFFTMHYGISLKDTTNNK
ncbi:unnamed protein product [Adineta steineri]|uniref:Globin-sensor domain-containing protein n=1 Tax=Adineta steineri TaxID=433720 RepID=A0A815AGG8_9BILA|nr:unnamed protein product [Adineta steineri]CAF1200651.1 unnamed protein product [Adineta steineri]CAF1255557.1 unnamed protein product [Adineta steineri]